MSGRNSLSVKGREEQSIIRVNEDKMLYLSLLASLCFSRQWKKEESWGDSSEEWGSQGLNQEIFPKLSLMLCLLHLQSTVEWQWRVWFLCRLKDNNERSVAKPLSRLNLLLILCFQISKQSLQSTNSTKDILRNVPSKANFDKKFYSRYDLIIEKLIN